MKISFSKPWIFRLRKAPLDLPILVFLGVYLLSFGGTLDRPASFFGVSGQWGTGLLALLVLLTCYVFLTQHAKIRTALLMERDTKILLVGMTILVAFGILLLSEFSLSSWRESWDVVFNTLFSGIKQFFFGSGPGTFSIDEARYGFNGEQFPWMAEVLATAGVTGLIAYLFLFLAAGLVALHLFKKTKGANVAVFFFIAWFLMLCVFFFVPFSAPVTVLFWTLLSLLGIPFVDQRFFLKLEHFFAKLVFDGVMLAFFGAMVVASVVFARGEISFMRNNAEAAARINPWMPEYQIASSRKFLIQLQEEIKKPVSQQDAQLLSFNLQQALFYGKRAVELSPARSSAWKQVGDVYKEMGEVQGALGWTVKAFEQAIKFEPKNPEYREDLGTLYAKQGKIAEARSQLELALLLDSRHKEARKQLALLAEQEGDGELAYEMMRETTLLFPEDEDLLFQLGRMEYNRGNVKGSIELFERVVGFSEFNSNARYALAIALEKEGRREEALYHFKKVLLLNPDNNDVRKKIEILEQ